MAKGRSCAMKKRDDAKDGGLTMVEVLVAITLLTVVLVVVVRGAVGALQAASVAKEHAVATSLISGDVAALGALPFSDLEAGLNPSVDALSTDANITKSGSTYTFKLNGATLLTANAKTSEAPLVPHISTVSVGIPFKVATYPTASSSSNLVTVTVVVTWKSPTGSTLQAVGQSQISPP